MTSNSNDQRDPGKPKCGGKKLGGDGLCARPAGWGTSHPGVGRCKRHGGSTPNHIAAAGRTIAEKAVATFGLSREIDPRDALLEEVYRTAGAVDWLHQQVQALRPEDVVWGKTQEVVRDSGEFPGTDTTMAAEVNVWVRLWQQERKHLIDVCKAAISVGLDERRVRLAEQQGALMASVFRNALDDAALHVEERRRVEQAFIRRMSAVAAPVIDGQAVPA